MAAKSSAGKKKDNPRGRSSTSRAKTRHSSGKKAANAARRPSRSSPGTSALLPSLAVWLVAVVVLAGLVYWGKSYKPRSHEVPSQQQAAAKPVSDPVKVPVAEKAHQEDRTAPLPHAKPVQPDRPAATAPPPVEPSTPKPVPKEPDRIASVAPIPKTIPPPVKPEPSPTIAQVAIVIDDFGQDLGAAKKFLNIPLAITYSILPFQAHSQEILQLAASRGHEVILHLPMEPVEYPRINPGRGALLVAMSENKIRQTVETALDAYPNIAGVNNHMGSKFTKQADAMKVVLAELKRRGLYFLDSFTTDQSVGYSLARELNVPTRRRDIFLDHENTETFVRSQIQQLIRRAKLQGSAVAIGHPYDTTHKVLLEAAPKFEKEGIAVVYSGRLIKAADGSKMNGG